MISIKQILTEISETAIGCLVEWYKARCNRRNDVKHAVTGRMVFSNADNRGLYIFKIRVFYKA